MRSLFSKILLWFAATATLTIGGFVVITALTISSSRTSQMPFAMLLSFQATEAERAYETDGLAGLALTLARFSRHGRVESILTDASGVDLLTGTNYAGLIHDATTGPDHPVFHAGRLVLVYPTEDNRFWYLLIMPRRRLFWFLHPQHLIIVAGALALCYLLARHLTMPVRHLQRAVERFGKGELDARVHSVRQDELGELGRTFDRMAGRIQTLLTAERRLLLDISHELRSPLARLSVAVELARSGEDKERALNRIEKEADRLNALVGELLQVTRAEGDSTQLHTDTVRIDELVAEVVDDCQIEAQARGCSVVYEGQPVTVQGDAELLRRAVENVIRNAIRYEPEGSAVEVLLAPADGKVRMDVRDHGPGVPVEALPRLFDPFFRVESDRGRTTGGVGLGLAIARRAIELHGGTIRAGNADPGLSVSMEIPLKV